MAATLRVPVIFSAEDKISSVVRTMNKNVSSFASGSERLFRKFSPTFSTIQKQFLELASAATIAAGIVSGVNFSVKSLMDYETAVASFRTIVSDLSNEDFAKFKTEIGSVANATNRSTIEVANAFENIAGLNAKFAETSEGLGKVTKAAITMASASGDALDSSAASLVGIMNQFGLMEDQADRTINVLAAGQAVGAASITQTAESFKNFGSVASGANISLEESVGLIQTLGKYSVFGAEAGTKLRGSVLKLQQAGMGYASGQFNINDALEETSKKLSKLKTAKQQDAFLTKMFGAENISTGRILLSNIDTFKEYTAGVTGTNEAQKAAGINNDTLATKIEQLKNKWVNLITTTDESSKALSIAKDAISWVGDNLGALALIVGGYLGLMGSWFVLNKLIIFTQAAMNVVMGISAVIQGKSAIASRGNTMALLAYKTAATIVTGITKAWNVVTGIATAVQWAFNAAMMANPIGLIILLIVGLIAVIYVIIKKWEDWGAALSLALGPLGMIISLIQSFRKHWDSIKKAFTDGGIVAGLKRIGVVILDALLTPIESLLKLISKIPGMKGLTDVGLANIDALRAKLDIKNESKNPEEPAPALNSPAVTQQQITNETITESRGILDINLNDPGSNIQDVTSTGLDIPINVTPTNNQR